MFSVFPINSKFRGTAFIQNVSLKSTLYLNNVMNTDIAFYIFYTHLKNDDVLNHLDIIRISFPG